MHQFPAFGTNEKKRSCRELQLRFFVFQNRRAILENRPGGLFQIFNFVGLHVFVQVRCLNSTHVDLPIMDVVGGGVFQ